MREKFIWFDMDGTIVNFYGVEGWLDDLQNRNARPYKEAPPLYNTKELAEVMKALKARGYKIGVVSWGSKTADAAFLHEISIAKMEWLKNQKIFSLIDKMIVTSYGVNKAAICESYGAGILVDDEEGNRREWNLGRTIDAKNDILKALRNI